MTPDEWSDRRIDDLAQQVKLMAPAITLIAAHDIKIDGVQDDVREGREAQRELGIEVRGMVKAIGEACEAHYRSVSGKIDRVEENIDKRFKDQAAEQKKERAEREARTMSLWQKVAIAFTVAGVLSSPVILLLGIGPG